MRLAQVGSKFASKFGGLSFKYFALQVFCVSLKSTSSKSKSSVSKHSVSSSAGANNHKVKMLADLLARTSELGFQVRREKLK